MEGCDDKLLVQTASLLRSLSTGYLEVDVCRRTRRVQQDRPPV